MSVSYKYFTFLSDVDGLEIFCTAIIPQENIIGVVQLVHGMCEHRKRYYPFMEFLAQKGYLCVIHDNSGHGESIEDISYLGPFHDGGYEALVDDIRKLQFMVKEKISDVPYILLGHSMGSMAVRCFMKKYDSCIDKVILCGSPSYFTATPFGLFVAKIACKIKKKNKHSKLLDYLVVNSTFEAKFKGPLHSWICSDPEVVEIYNQDPLCNFTFTVNGYRELLKLTMECYSKKYWNMNNKNLPILFVSGKEDPCHISPKNFGKSVHFLKDRGYEDVTARLYGGMRHEILNEKKKNRVYRDIYNFIKNGKLI